MSNSATPLLKHFTAAVPGILFGSATPDFENEQVVQFVASRFTHVFDLREEPPNFEETKKKLEAAAAKNNNNNRKIHVHHFPLADRQVPTLEQFEAMARFGREIASDFFSSSSTSTLVWCKAGIGRTAYFLSVVFISLYLRQGEPGCEFDTDLSRLVPPPVTAGKVISYLKQDREVNISEEAVDKFIARLKLKRWPLVSRQFQPWSATTEMAVSSNEFLEDFHGVVNGIMSASSLPNPSITDIVGVLKHHGGFRSIINVEIANYSEAQQKDLKKENISLHHLQVRPGEGPTMKQALVFAEIFLNRSNWPVLVNGGRGRAGCVLAIGCAALRKAQDPHLQAVGSSQSDIISFVRSHIGPVAVENNEQKRVVHRFMHAVRLYNHNVIIPGVLSYCAHPGTHPTTSWLAVQQRGGTSLFTSIVSFTDEPLPGANLFESKGFLYHHIECKEGLVPAKDRLEFFIHKVLKNPSSWPILICSDNGFARSITMSVVSLLHLAHDKELAELLGEQLPASVEVSSANELLSLLVRNHHGDGPSLSQVSRLQIDAARRTQATLQNVKSPVSAASSAAAAGGGSHIVIDMDSYSDALAAAEADEKVHTSFIFFADHGAPADYVPPFPGSSHPLPGLSHLAAAVARDVKAKGRPDYFLIGGDNSYWSSFTLPKNDPKFYQCWRKPFIEDNPCLRGIPAKIVQGNHDWKDITGVDPVDGTPCPIGINYTTLGEDENPCGAWQCAGERGEKPHRNFSFRHPSLPYDDRSPTNLTKEEAEASVNLPDSEKVFIAAFDANATQKGLRKSAPHLLEMWNRDREWLVEQLAGAQECLWRFFMSHQPFFCEASGHLPEADFLRFGSTDAKGNPLLPLEPALNEKKIDCCLLGHEHSFHTQQRGPNNILHCVVGATMTNEHYGEMLDEIQQNRTDFVIDEHETGFLRVTVFRNKKIGTTRIILDHIDAADGKTIHRITRIKNTPLPASAEGVADPLGGLTENSMMMSGCFTSEGGSPGGMLDGLSSGGMDAESAYNALNHVEGQKIDRLVATSSEWSNPVVIIVESQGMIDKLKNLVEKISSVSFVFCFNNAASAVECIARLAKKKVPIAAVVSNMRRKHADSGLRLAAKLFTVSAQAQLPYFPPFVMFSTSATKAPQPAFAAGACVCFSWDIEHLQSLLLRFIEASRWARSAIDIYSRAASSLPGSHFAAACSASAASQQQEEAPPSSPIHRTSSNELRTNHCFTPFPEEFGGLIKASTNQQLLWTCECAAFEKIAKDISKVVVEESVIEGLSEKRHYYVCGETAVSYWAQVMRDHDVSDSRGRCNIFDVIVPSKEAASTFAHRISQTIRNHADTIRGYLAHASTRTEPSASFDDLVQIRSSNNNNNNNNNNNQEEDEEIFVEIDLSTIGDVTLNKSKKKEKEKKEEEENNNSYSFTWRVARLRVRSYPDDEKLTGKPQKSSLSAKLLSPQGVFPESADEYVNAVEAQKGTRFCAGLLVLSPQGLEYELQNDPKRNLEFNSHRNSLLAKLVKEIKKKM